jgi:hypothetical protein
MSFFYSSPAGESDFYILLASLAFGLLAGGKETRVMAFALAYQFFVMRLAMAFSLMAPVFGVMAIAASAFFVHRCNSGSLSRAFIGLCMIDILAHATSSLYSDLFPLVTTAIMYLEMLIIIGGGAKDGFLHYRHSGIRTARNAGNSTVYRNQTGN